MLNDRFAGAKPAGDDSVAALGDGEEGIYDAGSRDKRLIGAQSVLKRPWLAHRPLLTEGYLMLFFIIRRSYHGNSIVHREFAAMDLENAAAHPWRY